MAVKSYVVFGLGKFGRSVAVSLCKNGCEVLAVDIDEERVENVTGEVTYAVRANVTDPEVFKSLGLRNMDGAVVAIGENIEASVMAAILSKEAGIPYVIAKASSQTHGLVLKKVGADEIIFPERDMGSRVARNMTFGKFVDTFELSDRYSLVEMKMPEEWAGKSLCELDVRGRYGINVIASKRGEEIVANLKPDIPLQRDEVLLVVGDNQKLLKMNKRK